MSHFIAPSLLAADFLNLERDIDMINRSEADWLHIDIMDGSFVPNISFGQVLMPFIQKASTKPLDVHLMINDPDRYISQFVDMGAEIITVHLEACRHLHRTLAYIKECGAKAGIALNPHTSVDLIEDVLEDADLVCLMSVNPGYGGQKFIYQTIPKVKKLKEQIVIRNLATKIEIDGGVGLQNARVLVEAGADVLVAGSAVFKSENPHQTIIQLKTFAY